MIRKDHKRLRPFSLFVLMPCLVTKGNVESDGIETRTGRR